jgi:MFS family permease
MGMVGLALYSIAMLWGGLFATSQSSFAVAFILHGVLAGFFITTTASLGQRLFPKASYAQFASAMSIVISIAYIIVPFATGKLLDISNHTYRLTFFAGSALAILALMASFILHRQFMALGGPKEYRTPGESA